MRIEVEILGIAKRREHAAKICGDILHDEDECRAVGVSCIPKHEPAKRQEGDKSHVVGNQH